jgi:hypothetical protein
MTDISTENIQFNTDLEDDTQLIGSQLKTSNTRSLTSHSRSLYLKHGTRRLVKMILLITIISILIYVIHVVSDHKRNVLMKLEEERAQAVKWKANEERVKALTANAVNQANFLNDDSIIIRPLVLYVYSERADSRKNAIYFIQHGLHARADFIFIFNGETDLDKLLPKHVPNIRIVRRDNTCYDLGAIGEVLRSNNQELVKKYKRFIFINASVRGPFLPTWSNECWSDLFLNKINDKVKLVGTTYNCWGHHIQSMVLATDIVGLQIILAGNATDTTYETDPQWEDQWGNPNSLVGLTGCYNTKYKAVSAEMSVTHLIKKAGYNISVLMTSVTSDPNYDETCDDINKYNLASVSPYELIFIKARKGWENLMDEQLLEKMTEWHNTWNFNSWERCKMK